MTTVKVEDKNQLRCDLGPYARVRYYHGMVLTDSHFQDEQTYHRQRRERLNHFIHGSGILCGLTLSSCHCGVRISPGAALDCRGRLIEVCDALTIDLSHICDEERKQCAPNQTPASKELCLALRYNERKAGLEAVYVPGADCNNKSSDYSRVQEGYCVVLVDDCKPQPCCECSEEACNQDPADLQKALNSVQKQLETLCKPAECCDCPPENDDVVILGKVLLDCDKSSVDVTGYGAFRKYVWTSEKSRVLHQALCEMRCLYDRMLDFQRKVARSDQAQDKMEKDLGEIRENVSLLGNEIRHYARVEQVSALVREDLRSKFQQMEDKKKTYNLESLRSLLTND